MEWFKCSDRLPQISYFESNQEDVPYECYSCLVYCKEAPGIFSVAHLCIVQDEEKWNDGEYYWQVYVPGPGSHIISIDFEVFTHWMPLPDAPKE